MIRPLALLTCVGLLAPALVADAAFAQGRRGPTVYVAPGDPTPFRRSDETSLYRDRGRGFEPRERTRIEPLERSATRTPGRVERGQIERSLEAGEVPAVAPDVSILDQFQRQLELQQAGSRLRRLRSVNPDDPAIRELERDLEARQSENDQVP